MGEYLEIKSVIIYGSRAMGKHRFNSDIDISMQGEYLDLSLKLKIDNELDNLLLPFKNDLSIQKNIENNDLLEHIDRVGLVFYEKELDRI
ncbi:MAG: nucleotidyltransferase domain-containing protein [Cytophagales bacterium]